MSQLEKTIFISYRRTDVYTALAVYQFLTGHGYDVFFDYTSIPSGDFEQIIVSNIKGRAHFLLILTPTALDRCSEPNDWLRREIETAMDEQRNIIPLFFKGFSFGSPSLAGKLTGKLEHLSRYNGLNVHEDYFLAAMDRLRTQFLNVPLDTVLHPVSTEVRKVVKAEQNAVDQVLRKRLDIRELLKLGSEKTSPVKETTDQTNATTEFEQAHSAVRKSAKILSPRLYGIGAGVLVAAVLGIYGVNSLIQNTSKETIPTATIPALTSTSVIESPVASATFTPTVGPPTLTITPVQLSGGFKLVYFSQQDPRWKDELVGNGTATIGEWGNLLTSLAMLVDGFGYEETPHTLNEKMKQAGGFQGSLLIPSVIPYVFPNVAYRDMVPSESVPAPLTEIDTSLNKGLPVIVQVDADPDVSGIQTHFVLVYARRGEDYLMIDPKPYPPDPTKEQSLLQNYGYGGTLETAISATLFFD